MATSVLRAPGLNSAISIVLFFISCSRQPGEPIYYNQKETDITTTRGIAYTNNKSLTGIVYSLNENYDTIAVIPYHNGRQHGICRYYYESGRPKSSRPYINGSKEGEHLGWFENGDLQFNFHFENDMFEGNQKEWLADGQLYSDLNYHEGMESGSQKVWNPDGSIKTNYMIINDRRYGLLGTKNCVNVVDSVFRQ